MNPPRHNLNRFTGHWATCFWLSTEKPQSRKGVKPSAKGTSANPRTSTNPSRRFAWSALRPRSRLPTCIGSNCRPLPFAARPAGCRNGSRPPGTAPPAVPFPASCTRRPPPRHGPTTSAPKIRAPARSSPAPHAYIHSKILHPKICIPRFASQDLRPKICVPRFFRPRSRCAFSHRRIARLDVSVRSWPNCAIRMAK
jgi:hypothetical protein